MCLTKRDKGNGSIVDEDVEWAVSLLEACDKLLRGGEGGEVKVHELELQLVFSSAQLLPHALHSLDTF